MSAQGAYRCGGGTEVHPATLPWGERKNVRSEPRQPTVPFGGALTKPASKVKENEESELRATVGTSVERLMNQQRASQQKAEKVQDDSDRLQTAVILLKEYSAKFYDKRIKRFVYDILLEKGNILRSLSVKYDADILRKLKEVYEKEDPIEEPMYMQCIDVDTACVRVSYKSIALLDARQANILRAIPNCYNRLKLFSDVARFKFIVNLQAGDKVTVQRVSSTDRTKRCDDGYIAWIGELKIEQGIFFGVTVKNFDENKAGGPGTLENTSKSVKKELIYVIGDMLYNPDVMKTHSAQASSFFGPKPQMFTTDSVDSSLTSDEECGKNSRIRQVPIRLVPNAHREPESSVKSLRPGVHSTRRDIENSSRDRNYFANFPNSSRGMPNGYHDGFAQKPSVSYENTSTESTPILEPERKSLETSRIQYIDQMASASSPEAQMKMKVGDKVVWNGQPVARLGTIHWIGQLPGHSHRYAGVEFEDRIGRGTGRFEGHDMFYAKRDHAAFLPLFSLKRSTYNSSETEDSLSTKAVRIPRPPNNTVKYYQPEEKPSPYGIEPPCVRSESCFVAEVPVSAPVATAKFPLIPWHASSLAKEPCVLIDYLNYQRFGVVRWIGTKLDEKDDDVATAAVEIEGHLPEEWPNASGALCNVNENLLFPSAGEIALVPLSSLFEDQRFVSNSSDHPDNMTASQSAKTEEKNFGTFDSGIEETPLTPTNCVADLVGDMKGIQGRRNSCYLDTTLYAMFVQCTAFDHLLRFKKDATNSPRTQFIKVLATEIVYPLRRHSFVNADHVNKLRELLQSLIPEMQGLTNEEKDPEELLTALFSSVFKAEPFLTMRNLNGGKVDTAYICPLITDDVWSNQQKLLTSVQSLLERSLYASNIQFAKEPKILILQLPRYGKEKVFCKVVPQQELDVTHLIYNVRRPCVTCSKQAELICPECFLTNEIFLGEVTYCRVCYKRAHNGFDHQPQPIKTEGHSPLDSFTRKPPIAKRKLQLSAVLSIETSHYVAFVRSLSTNKWFLYDSMADRVGLENGFNVPRVKCCERVPQWLSESGLAKLRNCFEKGHSLPSEVENDPDLMRLLSDCYICFYTSCASDESTGNLMSRLRS